MTTTAAMKISVSTFDMSHIARRHRHTSKATPTTISVTRIANWTGVIVHISARHHHQPSRISTAHHDQHDDDRASVTTTDIAAAKCPPVSLTDR
jgi:hypothetical protein